ncbi:periplasmic heavy metal sensor [Roseibacterium sp. SDUM158017]|uniref:periplasmic heavy metal sensor n=1 Tax=Roseicyclus salinarum TaxID=3036773 RepID=UPI0024154765|nr:periplasmic heavy metal sensor [Roseibacterium sp. SDUM158017]MDG4648610.1 periplasmic heavy metal sensor [Roseibacterium sp. SDUM158017]
MSETDRAPRRTGRGIKIALAVSLALNLLVAGLVAGAMLAHGGRGDAPAIRMLGLGPFALALPREGRDEVRERLAEGMTGLRAERARIGSSLGQVRRALLAEPFDREAAARALAASRDAAAALQAGGHAALLDTLAGMSLDERERVADRLGRALRHAPGSGDRPPRD